VSKIKINFLKVRLSKNKNKNRNRNAYFLLVSLEEPYLK
jgi:hypothetical protein